MKIKILFISQYLNVAGTEAFMMNVLRKINKTRFHIDFLIFSEEESNYSNEVEKSGSIIYRLPNRRSGFKYYKQLNLFFMEKSNEYQVFHFCGGNVSSIAPLYYAYKHNIPIRIVHSHSSSCEGFHNILLHYFNRLFIPKFCTHLFACSSKAAKFFFGKRKAEIIKNGINVNSYIFNRQEREQFRNELGISTPTKVVGHIGRFEEVKNHSFIIDVFKKFNELNPDSALILVGIGSLFEDIRKKVEHWGLSNNVHFLGERTDIPKILSAMDCFLMPSIYEGLPFVLIEAQASGLPCVISNTINKDAKITPYLHYCELNSDVTKWVNTIENALSFENRENATQYIEKAGFNINETIKFLETTYSNYDS